jgi:hypothetical protein
MPGAVELSTRAAAYRREDGPMCAHALDLEATRRSTLTYRMRIAIFSDVHSNLPALEATLADIAAVGVDVRYALGDLVGYAPWPNAVLSPSAPPTSHTQCSPWASSSTIRARLGSATACSARRSAAVMELAAA